MVFRRIWRGIEPFLRLLDEQSPELIRDLIERRDVGGVTILTDKNPDLPDDSDQYVMRIAERGRENGWFLGGLYFTYSVRPSEVVQIVGKTHSQTYRFRVHMVGGNDSQQYGFKPKRGLTRTEAKEYAFALCDYFKAFNPVALMDGTAIHRIQQTPGRSVGSES